MNIRERRRRRIVLYIKTCSCHILFSSHCDLMATRCQRCGRLFSRNYDLKRHLLTVHGSSSDGSPSNRMATFSEDKWKQKDEGDSTETSSQDDSEENSSGESSQESETEDDSEIRWWSFANDETERHCRGRDEQKRADCFLKQVIRLFALTQGMTKEEAFEAVKASAEKFEEEEDLIESDEAIEAAINFWAPKILKFMDSESDEEMEEDDDADEQKEEPDEMEQSEDESDEVDQSEDSEGDDEESIDHWELINAKCEELYRENQRLPRETCFLKAFRYFFFVIDDFQNSEVYAAIDSSRRKLLQEDKYLDKSEAIEEAVIIRKRNILKFLEEEEEEDEDEDLASD